ncbi:MAG: hypothetical protein ACOY0T_07850 [Myxococcota bacterium]
MNATKPDSAATSIPNEAPGGQPPRRRARTNQRSAAKPGPERTESGEIDFERHDTIPAPTWLDEGNESS